MKTKYFEWFWKIVFVLAIVAVIAILFMAGRSNPTAAQQQEEKRRNSAEYDLGFSCALDAIVLHDLELSLAGKTATWGERVDILRKRYNVPESGKLIAEDKKK